MAAVLLLAQLASAAAAQLRGPPGRASTEEARLRSAILLNPQVAAYHASLGELLRVQGRLPEAVQSLQEATRLAPRSAAYAAALGRALLEMEQWEPAAAAYGRAVELDPAHTGHYVGLARAQEAMGRVVEARQTLRRALAVDPADTLAQRLWREVGDPQPSADAGARSVLDALLLAVRGVAVVVLSLAGVGLVLPILGALFLLLIRVPLALIQRLGATTS